MQQVGRYRLTRRLGQGGMAEVFEAVAEGEGGFRRTVAVKRVLPQLSQDASIARMFLDEARTTSHLHHGNIVSVVDYGTADGSAFQVLEYVDGLDLERLCRRAGERQADLPVGLAVYIVMQVARALDYAHNAKDHAGLPLGIVHRDVSPSNVLVSWDGHVKLTDFGIALAADRLERTEGVGVKGKLEYMSPEQAMRGHIDRRSDVFALGCLLQRLISGKSPLAELTTLARMTSGEELPLDPTLDEGIRPVIARATRNAQSQRYPNAAEFSRALSELLPVYLAQEATCSLQDWLAVLRDDGVAEKKRGALDALLSLDLVLSASDSASSERTFVTCAEQAATIPLATAPDAPVSNAPDAPAASNTTGVTLASRATTRARRARERRRLARGLGTLAFATLMAFALHFMVGTPAAPTSRAPPIPPPAASRRTPTEPSVDKTNVTKEVPRPPDVADVAEPSAQTRSTRSTRGRTRIETARVAPQAAPTPPEPPSGRGTLVIGGHGALRAEIRIDGRAMGFAPKRVELSTGSHEIVLLLPDGTRLGPHSVRIEAQHTQSAPAKWIVN